MNVLRKNRIRILSLLLTAILLLAGLPHGAMAVTQDEIDELKEQVKKLEEEKKEYGAQLSALSDDMSAALARKALLDAQIAATEEQITATEEIIAYYESEIILLEQDIEVTELELEKARTAAADTYDLYCETVRALEEGGNTTYWGILFGATSFSDMLTRMDFVREVLSYNESVILSYNDLCTEIAAGEIALRAQLAEKQDVITATQEARADLEIRSHELENQRAEAIELVLEIDNNQTAYQEIINELEADRADVEAQIKQKEAELAEQRRKEEEARRKAEEARRRSQSGSSGSSSSGGSGSSGGASRGFIWPVPSRRVTSYFGYRTAGATNGVGSTNHKGIDIGQVYYSTTVVAAKAGRVSIATFSSSYGNYVMIDHGDGSVTVYAHMSRLLVSAGQRVSQGQAIGVTGSTGHSTGPHLHFEIRINGQYVNPLNYLP